MRYLVIDFSCNAIDLAALLSQQPEGVDHVFVLSDMACPEVWRSERLTCVQVDRIDPAWVATWVEEQSIDLVINFSALFGSAGVMDRLAERGIPAIGTNRHFARSEFSKLEFKRWMMDQHIATPAIRFEGVADDLLARRDTFDYPLVVKPDTQLGPLTTVIASADHLAEYFASTFAQFPDAADRILFVVEDCVEAGPLLQVHYLMSDGRGVPVTCAKTTPVPKSPLNPGGAVFGLNPWNEIPRYAETIRSVVSRVADWANCSGMGVLQFMRGADGELYVIENNARPAAACPYDPFADLVDLVRAIREGDLATIEQNSFLEAKNEFWLAAPLIHEAEHLPVSNEEFDRLRSVEGIKPYSFRWDGERFRSEHGRMLSTLNVFAHTPEDAIETFNQRARAVSDILAVRVATAEPDVFDA